MKLFYNYNTLATEDLSDFWAHGHEWIAHYDERFTIGSRRRFY